ncbi:hypothetical protein [Pseudonocardia lacus]|uniref:hypothetical protein n=1 Tax=Pseudonocardia lacus TaxID=2835865 RepID=UPI001BDDA8C3|nr:hypothetical protein [Pseudonocardia lacus]
MTGIGETAALVRDALDLDAGTVDVRGTVVRIKGHGLSIKWRPKSKNGFRTPDLPSWAVTMLRTRAAADPDPGAATRSSARRRWAASGIR